jgi:hypothetical protein
MSNLSTLKNLDIYGNIKFQITDCIEAKNYKLFSYYLP